MNLNLLLDCFAPNFQFASTYGHMPKMIQIISEYHECYGKEIFQAQRLHLLSITTPTEETYLTIQEVDLRQYF